MIRLDKEQVYVAHKTHTLKKNRYFKKRKKK